jgi:hypothetical protein
MPDLLIEFRPTHADTAPMATHQTVHLAQAHATPVHVLFAGKDAHERQRELVRASLLACPTATRPTHRRWA